MERKLVHGVLGIVLVSGVLSGGCAHDSLPPSAEKLPTPSGNSSPKPGEAAKVDLPKVSDRPANHDGAVFVVEYHHLGDSKNSMFRSEDKFRGDLERFDKMGFRPVTVTEYLQNKMPLGPGASPMVFTFDDANPDQVKLTPDGKLDPHCFLGIWQEFSKNHPEFPIHATFFVLPSMWGQSKMLDQKLALLKSFGCELGNHTITHPILRRLSDDQVKQEVGEAEIRLSKLGAPTPAPLALPFGSSPKNKTLLEGFDYKGVHIAPTGVFLVGANPAPAPTSPKLNKLRIPRIQAYSGPYGIDYWLDKVDQGSVKLYVQ